MPAKHSILRPRVTPMAPALWASGRTLSGWGMWSYKTRRTPLSSRECVGALSSPPGASSRQPFTHRLCAAALGEHSTAHTPVEVAASSIGVLDRLRRPRALRRRAVRAVSGEGRGGGGGVNGECVWRTVAAG